jgi:hypothetical protein
MVSRGSAISRRAVSRPSAERRGFRPASRPRTRALKLFQQIGQLVGSSAKAIETPENEGVATPKVGQGGRQSVDRSGHRRPVLENPMAAELPQCVALKIELLVLRWPL